MKLQINDEPYEWAGENRLSALLEGLDVPVASVATLVNGEVVPMARRADCALQDCDRVDLLTFAAGG